MYTGVKILAAVAVLTSTVVANSGNMTWFYPGLGACGWWSNDGQAVVALNPWDWAGGSHCGQWITIWGNGRTTAGLVVDLCPGCRYGGVDASPAIFDDIISLDVGYTFVDWAFQ
ncbi:RlpA-like double-psi beta-barrel-protein domain-containing protein-containing protein [Xylaria intraflava]|nr:RlpA-like double-psi beta-barrel-protein domain-containing protein-containing protein [Xylaria intraflava]